MEHLANKPRGERERRLQLLARRYKAAARDKRKADMEEIQAYMVVLYEQGLPASARRRNGDGKAGDGR